jgi:hypothetical protein
VLSITSVRIGGQSASLFAVDTTNATLDQDEFLRIRISLSSPAPLDYSQLQAMIIISNSVTGTFAVTIRGETIPSY